MLVLPTLPTKASTRSSEETVREVMYARMRMSDVSHAKTASEISTPEPWSEFRLWVGASSERDPGEFDRVGELPLGRHCVTA